jgi:hypothetical protein
MRRDIARPAAMARGEPCGNDHTGELISPTDKPQERVGQLIDKYGHVHSEAVLRNWTPAAVKALGIHRLTGRE